MNKLFTLIVIALLIVIGYAFYTAVDIFAASDNTVSICDTVDANVTAAYNGHNVDSLDANSRHCVADSKIDTVSSDRHQDEDSPIISTVITVVVNVTPAPIVTNTIPVIVTDDTTPVPAPVVTNDKPKCNNGEGNGSEGCSPAKSDNANNDENQTTPSQDKSGK